MRKLFALAMVAILSLTIALAVVSCGKKTEETTTTEAPPAETSMPDTGSMMDTTMMDTTMHQ